MIRVIIIVTLPLLLGGGCVRTECGSADAFGNLGPLVNSPFDDYGPVLQDTTMLTFTSTRLGPRGGGLRELADDNRSATIYRTFHLTDEWDRPLRYDLLKSEERDQELATLSFPPRNNRSGVVAYAGSCDTEDLDGPGGCDLVMVLGSEGRGSLTPVPAINSDGWDGHPFATRDGTRLYFASDRDGGFGGNDIWYVEIDESGLWGRPQNAGSAINSPGDESSPYLDEKSGDFYFAAENSAGDLDIHVLRDGDASRTVLPPPINTADQEITPYLIGTTLYLASDRSGGCGGFDLYSFPQSRSRR